jgi:hypothetical protein
MWACYQSSGEGRRRSSTWSTGVTTRAPTIVTTNRGLPEWGEIFGDAVVAGAIVDRLMHKAVVFNIRGPSWRMRERQALTAATRNQPNDKHEERRRR